MIHLVREKMDGSDEYLGLIEGGGVCLADSFDNAKDADAWLRSMFARLYPAHVCDLGCISLPHSEFLADVGRLDELACLGDPRTR